MLVLFSILYQIQWRRLFTCIFRKQADGAKIFRHLYRINNEYIKSRQLTRTDSRYNRYVVQFKYNRKQQIKYSIQVPFTRCNMDYCSYTTNLQIIKFGKFSLLHYEMETGNF